MMFVVIPNIVAWYILNFFGPQPRNRGIFGVGRVGGYEYYPVDNDGRELRLPGEDPESETYISAAKNIGGEGEEDGEEEAENADTNTAAEDSVSDRDCLANTENSNDNPQSCIRGRRDARSTDAREHSGTPSLSSGSGSAAESAASSTASRDYSSTPSLSSGSGSASDSEGPVTPPHGRVQANAFLRRRPLQPHPIQLFEPVADDEVNDDVATFVHIEYART